MIGDMDVGSVLRVDCVCEGIENIRRNRMSDIFCYVNEIFPSLQGEGLLCGVRSLFIRFHFCNLRCFWCDSKYTWNRKAALYEAYSADELKEVILKYNIKNVVLTGGEPCLYRLDLLYLKGFNFQVETNGTFFPTQPLKITLPDKTSFEREAMQLDIVKRYQWIVSPKLSYTKQFFNRKVVDLFSYLDNAFFKFVIADIERDLEEVNDIVLEYDIYPQNVYISFEGIDRASQLKSEWVEKVIRRYNYSPRLQVLYWPGQRK